MYETEFLCFISLSGEQDACHDTEIQKKNTMFVRCWESSICGSVKSLSNL